MDAETEEAIDELQDRVYEDIAMMRQRITRLEDLASKSLDGDVEAELSSGERAAIFSIEQVGALDMTKKNQRAVTIVSNWRDWMTEGRKGNYLNAGNVCPAPGTTTTLKHLLNHELPFQSSWKAVHRAMDHVPSITEGKVVSAKRRVKGDNQRILKQQEPLVTSFDEAADHIESVTDVDSDSIRGGVSVAD